VDAEGWIHVADLLVRCAVEQPASPNRPRGRANEAAEDAPREERPPYVAPEVVEEGLLTPFSDQYSLAALVIECLTGAPPPEPDDLGVAPATSLAAARPELPPHVTHAVRRALSPKPVDRFPGVLDFVAALETYAVSLPEARPSGRSSSAVLVQTDWKPPENPLRRRFLLGGTAVVAATALVLVLWPVVSRMVGGRADRPASPYVKPTPDSATPVAPPVDSARAVATVATPAPPTLPPAREARRSPSSATPSAARPAQPTAERAQPRRERATPEAPPAAARDTSTSPSRTAQRAAAPATTPPPAAPAAASADPGYLFVNASPWGQLFVDGQLVGNTPKANLSLSPGSHAIRVVREGYAPFERTVQIAAGQTVRLTDIVLVARQ
jgi:hypothetical protein